MKICVFKVGAIGDVLMSTPLIRQIRKNFPNAQIDYLIGSYAFDAINQNKNVNKIISFDEKIFIKKKILEWIKLIYRIRAEKYDLIFVLDKHWVFNLTSKLFRIPRRVGFDRLGKGGVFLTDKIFYGAIRHEIHYYLDLAREIGLDVNYKDHKMELFIDKKDEEFANDFWKENKFNKSVIGICPGGGSNPGQTLNEKIWPVENFILLIKKLNNPVLLLGGPTDKNKEMKIIKKCQGIVSAIGKTTLKQTAALMAKCSKIICNDSGPMHMAACMNQEIISIFGPVHPKRKAPLWKKSKYLWKAEKLYNQNNETFGTYEKQNYFHDLYVEDILNALNT